MKAKVKEWRPASYISSQQRRECFPDEPANPYALIILNQPISNTAVFSEAYNDGECILSMCACCSANVSRSARYVVCADGGANQFHEFPRERYQSIPWRDPDAICGDLDSIYTRVKEYYQAQRVPIITEPDQFSTDFTKCLKYIEKKFNKYIGDENISPEDRRSRHHGLDIAVIGGLGGRADQAFSQLHHLFAASGDPSLVRGDIYLITPESIIFVLEKGLNRIYTPVSADLLTENVGIIPLGRPAVITTRGLEWDVIDWPTEFGGQLSTSNHIRSEVIEVETSERVIFTVELAVKP